MMKYAFLAGAMILSAPAFAQDTPATDPLPQTAQSSPAMTDPNVAPQAAAPVESAPVAPAQGGVASAQPEAAAGPTQVAEVVSKEFPSYDKNGDGVLSAAEFDTWMVALKSASDPATKPNSPATKTWLNQAFAQADTDKNKKVSKSELTGFLTQQG